MLHNITLNESTQDEVLFQASNIDHSKQKTTEIKVSEVDSDASTCKKKADLIIKEV
jgi:hypothetical protein